MEDNRPYNFFCQIYLPHWRHTSTAAQCQTKLEFSFNKGGKITPWMLRWSHCWATERQSVQENDCKPTVYLLMISTAICLCFFLMICLVLALSPFSLHYAFCLQPFCIKCILLFFRTAPHLYFPLSPTQSLSPTCRPLLNTPQPSSPSCTLSN